MAAEAATWEAVRRPGQRAESAEGVVAGSGEGPNGPRKGLKGEGSKQHLHLDAAEAQGKQGEKRGGETAGAKVSRLQFHGRDQTEEADRAEGEGTFPRQGPGNHARAEGAKYAAANRGTDAIPARVARLLWFLRNSFCAGRAGFVGPEAATLRLLDRVEDGASAVRCSVSLGHLARAGGEYRGQQPRSLVPESEPCSEPGAFQRFLRLSGASAIGSQSVAQPAEPPYTDPYVRWCDRDSE